MIIPQPESDLSQNVLVVGADILKILKDNGNYIIIEELLKDFLNKDKKRTTSLFFETITFLYTVNLVTEQNYKIRINYGHTQANLL